jgi:hypothetical protein
MLLSFIQGRVTPEEIRKKDTKKEGKRTERKEKKENFFSSS